MEPKVIPGLRFSAYAVVRSNTKELDDKKFSLEEREKVERERRQRMESADQKLFGTDHHDRRGTKCPK